MQRGRWGARGGARRASPIATKPPLGCRGPGGVTSWTMTGETSTDPERRAARSCAVRQRAFPLAGSRWRGAACTTRSSSWSAGRPGHVAATTSCATRCTPRATAGSGRRPGSTPASPLCHVQRALRAIVPLRAPDPRRARAGRPTPPRGVIARFPARIVATARSSTRGRAFRCEPCRRDRAPGGRRHTRARPAAACRLAPPGAPHSRASSPPS